MSHNKEADHTYHLNHQAARNNRRREHRARTRETARQWAIEYLSQHPCVDCGETDIVVLEFDHVRGEKKQAIAELIQWGYPLEVLENEAAKCDVVCANDHRRRTCKRGKHYRTNIVTSSP